MNYRIALGLALFSLSTASFASSLCQEKEQDIQREISYAEKHNNQSRINGLNKALSEVKANCSDSKLRAEHKEEVAERRRDLAEAKEKGDADKVAKREQKLQEAQNELKALESRDY